MQCSSNFDILHDTWLISISSHDRGRKKKENIGYIRRPNQHKHINILTDKSTTISIYTILNEEKSRNLKENLGASHLELEKELYEESKQLQETK